MPKVRGQNWSEHYVSSIMTRTQSHVNQHEGSAEDLKAVKAEVHYRLTHEEFLTWIEKHNLKWSEVKLYLYFCTLNPFGDREIEFSPDLLYSQLKIKKSAFYSAVARLEKLGLLSLKVLRAKARIHPINRTTFHLNGKDSKKMDSTPVERKEVHKNGKSSNNSEFQQPKPPSDKDSSGTQTYSDYLNFIQTLSEGERESFLEFGRKKAAPLPHPPELPDKWIAANFTELHNQFLASPAGESAQKQIIQETDWTRHPEWSDWLAIMREGVPRFVALGTCFDNKTRRAIADWADERGLIWGTES